MAGVLVGLLLLGLPLLAIYLWRSRKKRPALASGPLSTREITSLTELWQKFLLRLPRATRPLVARYPAAIVLGPSGSGKSQLIRTFVDWQGQSSQFMPSLTENPLLQIYLGSKLVVQELGPQVLNNTAAATGEALRKLWRPLCHETAPLMIVALKLPAIQAAKPGERQDLANQIRGKAALLSKMVGGSIEVRIVITHMEQVPGFVEFARFCAAHRIPVSIPLTDSSRLSEAIDAADLGRFLPLALTKLPSTEFRRLVVFLENLPSLGDALDEFLQPLRAWSVSSQPPIVERIYFTSTTEGATGGNPFAGRKLQPVRNLTGRIKAALPSWLRGAQWHFIVSAVLVLLGVGICAGSALRQRRAIQEAEYAVEYFAQTVHRAEAALGDVRESPAVRAASRAARESIERVNVASEAWFLHRLLYRGTKTLLVSKLLESMRTAYFLPLLPRYGAQRDVERTLFTLAVIYAARDSALGSMVADELRDIAQALSISDVIITDYIQLSNQPWDGAAAVPWNRLINGPVPPAANPETWTRFFTQLQQVYRTQSVNAEQLRRQQLEALPLMRIADAVRTRRKLAQILNAIAEESPLVEIESRLGSHYPELVPPQWMRDQQVALSGVLHLVHDTDQQSLRAGQMNLNQVLQMLTELDARKRSEDQVFAFEIAERSFSFNARTWQDMLLRGRHQLVLGALYKATDLPLESATDSVAETGHHRRGHRHRHQAAGDSGGQLPTSEQSSAQASAQPSAQADSQPPDAEPGTHRRHHHHKHKRHERHHERKHRSKAPPETELASPSRSTSVTPQEARQYSRASYEQDMGTLLQKLDKALGDDSGLPGPQKQYLVRYVQNESRRYSERYCAAILSQYNSYVFPGGALSSTRASLVELLTPGGSLLLHLKKVVDNVNLPGLDGRFAQPLAACLMQTRPLVTLMMAGKDGSYPGLKPYSEIIAAVIKDFDTGKPADMKEDGKPTGLTDLLSPLGRIGFAVLTEQVTSPERKVELFLESAGLGGSLAQPFLAPVKHLTSLALAEINQVLSQQWETTLLPMVQPMLTRYPFDTNAERELQPAELETFKLGGGAFWTTFRQIYGPVLLEQNGVFTARKWSRGGLTMPTGMLPLANQLASLSASLWAKDGAKQPINLVVKALPMSVCNPENPTAVSFLLTSKSRVYGINGRPASAQLSLQWWQQDVSAVGIESAAGAKQRTGQAIEVADSQWSFFRLLEKASNSNGSVQTWALPNENGKQSCEVRFELDRNPLSLFRIRTGKKQ